MTETSEATSRTASAGFERARGKFGEARGYLDAASSGIPTRETVAALESDLDMWASAQRDPQDYDPIVARTRADYARLVGVAPDRVATGSQTSVLTSVIAAAVPSGAEVLCVDGDASSLVFPFLQRHGIRVRHVPIERLADSIEDDTWLVVFSHIQPATGVVADVSAIVDAASHQAAYTLCDMTQSAGVHPVDASLFDATVCHAYTWLCSPRGAAFLTLSTRFQKLLTPVQAGWYAGDDVWQSCYGPAMHLASTARQFDVSPVWQAWVGAEPAVRMFAELDMNDVWSHASGLGDKLCDALGIPQQHQAIVTWADREHADLQKLLAAGIRASGRAGRLRASFHLWNTEDDVAAVVRALRG